MIQHLRIHVSCIIIKLKIIELFLKYSSIVAGRFESPASKKRHKKHKKHKKKRSEYDDSDAIDVESEERLEEIYNPVTETAADKLKSQSTNATPSKPPATSPPKAQKKKRTRGRDSGTSSGEERWLDAIESGKLEEVDDELKKIKDPKLMTARQRAMYERGADKDSQPSGEVLMSLPSGYKEKVMTAEAIQKAQLKSQKRKQMADEKREKDKKKTMERLLKKQDSTKSKINKNKQTKNQVPMITYRNTADGATISFPPNFDFPLKAQVARDPPKPTLCAVPGCVNIKKYNCSKTNTPLCSYKCYKENISLINKIIC